jgi:hypothetical protein
MSNVRALYLLLAFSVLICARPLWAQKAQRAQGAQEPGLRVTDRSFLKAVASKLGAPEGGLLTGQVDLLMRTGSAASLIVFLDGTEVGRLEKPQADALLSDFPEVRRGLMDKGTLKGPSNRASRAGDAGGEDDASASASWFGSQDMDDFLGRMGHWDERASIDYDVDYLYSGTLIRRNRAEVSFVKKISIAYLGADVDYLSFKGELSDSVPYAAKASSFGWGVRVGFDFIRYHLQSSPYALPEYFWTESDLNAKYFARANPAGPAATVVKIFTATAPPGLVHSVEARFGALRYTVTVAPDVYTSPIHYLALDDLPGLIGTWGMGLVKTPDGFIPGAWYRFAPVGLSGIKLGGESGTRIPISLGLGRISYFRADRSQFRLAWSGELIFGLQSKEGN